MPKYSLFYMDVIQACYLAIFATANGLLNLAFLFFLPPFLHLPLPHLPFHLFLSSHHYFCTFYTLWLFSLHLGEVLPGIPPTGGLSLGCAHTGSLLAFLHPAHLLSTLLCFLAWAYPPPSGMLMDLSVLLYGVKPGIQGKVGPGGIHPLAHSCSRLVG